MELPQTVSKPKRVVMQNQNGIMQILSVYDEQPPSLMTFPSGESVNLVAVKERYYLYRTVLSVSDTNKRFDERQR